MRIITGIYKGRHFDVPRTFKARPTTDFAKENIFNVLGGYLDFDGITALDMLSRGSAQVISVEADRDHARFIAQCMKKIGADNNLLIRGDVFRFLKSCHQQFSLIFADPPYALEQLTTLPDLIFEHDLLVPEGIFVLEHGKDHSFESHPHFIDHRHYGSVNFSLFR